MQLPNPWPTSRLPRGAAAVLGALHFRDPGRDALQQLSEGEWHTALDFANRSQLTLALRRHCRDRMPPWVDEQTGRNALHNLARLEHLRGLYRQLSATLEAAGIEFAALKGLTHCPEFGSAAEDRAQYDIDLFVDPLLIEQARDRVMSLGFEPLEDMESFPTDHLPALIRKTGWEWRGDFFDPDMPVAVELHFRFWNGRFERLPAEGTGEFWKRRVVRLAGGMELPALSLPDALGFASLHVLKHILHASGRAFHVYEVACFLESHAADDRFWQVWREWHSPELRRLEAVAFRLALEWFGCRTGAVAQEEISRLPAGPQAWFEEFATSPAEQRFRSRKDELWLHMSLLGSSGDVWSVARRRLLPGRLPAPVDAVYLPPSELTWRRRVLKQARYAAYLASRVRHHIASLPSAATAGLRWGWRLWSRRFTANGKRGVRV